MAVFQSKRSVGKKQSALGKPQSAEPKNHKQTITSQEFTLPRKRVVHFRQAHGKLVKDIEFSSESGHEGISISFQDKTGLDFVIRTGFTLETAYSDWNGGEQRVLRKWRAVR